MHLRRTSQNPWWARSGEPIDFVASKGKRIMERVRDLEESRNGLRPGRSGREGRGLGTEATQIWEELVENRGSPNAAGEDAGGGA